MNVKCNTLIWILAFCSVTEGTDMSPVSAATLDSADLATQNSVF